MTTLDTREILAVQVVATIHIGSIDDLRQLLVTQSDLAASRLGDVTFGATPRALIDESRSAERRVAITREYGLSCLMCGGGAWRGRPGRLGI